MQTFAVRFTVFVLLGAVVGLAAGLLLAALDLVDNPYRMVWLGIVSTAVAIVSDQARRGFRGK